MLYFVYDIQYKLFFKFKSVQIKYIKTCLAAHERGYIFIFNIF